MQKKTKVRPLRNRITRIVNYFVLIALAILPFSIFSAIDKTETFRVRRNKLPIEFSLLIDSYQKYNLTEEERNWFKETIKKLDTNLSLLTKEETYFVIKTEIYKSLLLNQKKTRLYLKDVNKSLLRQLNEKIQTYKSSDQAVNKFTLWYLKALSADLASLFDSTFFQELMRRKRDGKSIEREEMKSIEKKLRILIPQVKRITNLQTGDLTLSMKPLLRQTLSKIHSYTKHLLILSRTTTPKDSAVLSFFTTKDLEDEELNQDVESIINEVEKNVMAEFTTPVIKKSGKISKKGKDDWKPKGLPSNYPKTDPYYASPSSLPDPVGDWGDAVTRKKGLKSYQRANPNYIPPRYLPDPVDDWLDPTDIAKTPKNIPTPSAGYQAPATLPKPVNDWIPESD